MESSSEETGMRRIVVCIDGTWNHPDQKDHGLPSPSNVFKFWKLLVGSRRYDQGINAEYAKVFLGQRALYYRGVGNAAQHNWFVQRFAGATGAGAAAIRKRAFEDVVRLVSGGEAEVCVVGFSRGAAIARTLANQIGEETDLPVTFLGCWDTVASFGLPKSLGWLPFQKINLFKNLTVARCVRYAVHCLALDERRDTFEPTLMNPQPGRVNQQWFPGVHGDVGGAYSDRGVSDVTLSFMVEEAASCGVLFRYIGPDDMRADPRGMIHTSGTMWDDLEPRKVPDWTVVHDSVMLRRNSMPEYDPPNLKDKEHG